GGMVAAPPRLARPCSGGSAWAEFCPVADGPDRTDRPAADQELGDEGRPLVEGTMDVQRAGTAELGGSPSLGLYDPSLDKASCGVGFIAHIKGQKSHQIVRDALTILL